MQKRLFLSIIALFILIPSTGVITGLGAMSAQEMRISEGRNKASFQEDFPKWFTDNLGLRQFFANTYSTFLLFLFDQSSDPVRVQIGQNGFLFLGGTLPSHARHPSSSKVLASLGNGFKDIITLFQKQEIPVLIAIAPDKATIYGEYFPRWVKRVSSTIPRDSFNKSPLLKKYVLFLEDALLAYKKHSDILYWKNDTHWNPFGAFLGYSTIMDGIERILEKKMDRIQLLGFKTGKYHRGDLERMNRAAKTHENNIDLLTTQMKNKVSGTKEGKVSKYTNKNYINELNVAIIHDSFYYSLASVYRNTFNTTYEINLGRLDTQTVETFLSEKPPLDLVIFLLVERNFFRLDALLKKIAEELLPAERH